MPPDRPEVSVLVVGDAAGATADRLADVEDRIAATTADPQAAVATVEDDHVDCLVVDPWPVGPTDEGFLPAVRSVVPGLPVVAVVEDREGASDALAAGVTDYVLGGVEGTDRALAGRILDAVVRRSVERDRADDDRYRQLVGSSPFPVFVLDSECRVLYGNRASADFLDGRSGPRADLEGRSLCSLVHPDDAPTIERGVADAVRRGTVSTDAELRIDATADDAAADDYRHVKVAVAPTAYRGESAAQVIVSDVTAYKRLNEDLHRLHSLSSRRDADFEEKVEAVLELGRERFDVDVAFLSAIDRSFEVVAARGGHPLIQPGTEAPLSQTYCRKAIVRDEPLVVENAPEEGWVGDVAYETYGLSCYLGTKVVVDGGLYGTLCFADADVTRTFSEADRTLVDLMARWVGYEIDRQQYLEELQGQNERFEQLAEALSHDLGNLLEVGRSHVEYAHETGDVDRLADAMDAHDRAADLLKHMVQLTRAGKRIDDTEAIDLAVLATEAWTHVDADRADLEITEDLTVAADRKRLLQLLENLFRNSVEHGSTGGGSGTDGTPGDDPITVRVGAVDDGFYVEDDGVGIASGDRERVFESGYSGDEDGTGLGLAIVEQVAKAHGWSVRVTEASDGGARFEVTGVEGRA